MRNILVLGAGRSSSYLIKYLLDHAQSENWNVTVADVTIESALQKTSGNPRSKAIQFDVNNAGQCEKEVTAHDLIVSLLPPALHLSVAKICIQKKKHMVTASYVTKEMKELDTEATKAGIILLNEIGLDPGIDHASAMKIIHEIQSQGGIITSFKSYCGGLVAPESNDNPWGYKFSWNPRNVILAGQGTAKYIEQGKYKYIPYNRLFLQTETIKVKGLGTFEGYANRDSLSYRKPYGLENISTMLRGTFRMPGYCKAWNSFVKLGLTDDTYKIEKSESITFLQLLESLLPAGKGSLKKQVAKFLGEKESSPVMKKLDWLGIFKNSRTGLANASPAEILQRLLEEKWKLKKNDKDMIVMQHLFEYTLPGKKKVNKKITSSLVVKGEDQVFTAMAKTVGLPAAIGAKLILNNKIQSKGVLIPVINEIYEPLLQELEEIGVKFEES